MHRVIAAAAICLLGGRSALAAPLLNAEELAVDLGYGIYQGSHNFTTQLNVWKGYVKSVTIGQGPDKQARSTDHAFTVFVTPPHQLAIYVFEHRCLQQ